MGRAAAVALGVATLASSGTAAAGQTPGASAQAWAVRVVVPGAKGAGTTVVSVPPAGSSASVARFVYPSSGSVIATGLAKASASTAIGTEARADAMSGVAVVSIFSGEIKAETVTASATAATSKADASGSFTGTGIGGLRVFGNPVVKKHVTLGDWGVLTQGATGVDTSAPVGAAGYHGFITALDIRLSSAHGGLPAGSEIQLGYAETDVQTAVGAVPPLPEAPGAPLGPMPGDRPQLLPHIPQALIGVPQILTPALSGGPYVFPVFGPSSFIDTYGVGRPDVNYHHGDDIFGQLGQPLVAVASGVVFSIGWNRLGGNRLWLRDHQGNVFYYAHLAAFSTNARNGAHVKAGEVIGFMGSSGDAEGGATHLHFEVHPVSLLYIGYDGAVDPTTYLRGWRRIEHLAFPVATGWAPSPPGVTNAAEPGAILIAANDIASGGLAVAKTRS